MTGQLVVAALAAAGVIACCATARPPAPHPANTDCCVELVARVDPRFSKEERKAIDDGLSAWYESTGGRACVWVTDGQRFDLVIVRAESEMDFAPFSNEPQMLLGFYSRGMIQLRTNYVDRSLWSTLMAHEQGHAMGMAHRDDDYASIMQSHLVAAMPGGRIPQSDVSAFLEANRCR